MDTTTASDSQSLPTIAERVAELRGQVQPVITTTAPADAQLPPGVALASARRRYAALALNGLLAAATLGIGWAIWALVLWNDGQNPGQRMLGLRVIDDATKRVPSQGQMVTRNIVGYFLGTILMSALILPMALLLMPLWDAKKQAVWDKLARTVVVYDPDRVLQPL